MGAPRWRVSQTFLFWNRDETRSAQGTSKVLDESALLAVGKLLAVLALVAANGFFVASEFALVGMRRSRVEELAAGGHKTARLLGRAIDNLDANLAATQLGVTI